MALVAGERFPDWSSQIMALTIASTVVFEIVGPPVTFAAIRRTAGAAPGGGHAKHSDDPS